MDPDIIALTRAFERMAEAAEQRHRKRMRTIVLAGVAMVLVLAATTLALHFVLSRSPMVRL